MLFFQKMLKMLSTQNKNMLNRFGSSFLTAVFVRNIRSLSPFVLGTVLGDGYIDSCGRLCIEHSSKQSAYVTWKYEQLREIGLLPSTSVIKARLKTRR
jgi:hypothetical protein